MRKKKKIKYSIKPKLRAAEYSDINKKLIFFLSFLAIVALVVVIVLITDAVQPPNVSFASKEIFEKGMVIVGVRDDLGSFCTYNEEKGKYEGFEIDVCEEVFERIFHDQVVIRYEKIYTTTKLSRLYRREIDVCVGAFVPNSSKNIPINYTDGFFVDKSAIVVRKDQRINVLNANKVIIGVINNSYTHKNIEDYLARVSEAMPEDQRQEYEIIPFASYQDLFEAVTTFKVDAISCGMLYISLFMQDDLVLLPDRFLYHDYCIALNAYDDELTKVFNEAIYSMKVDGTLEKLKNKWDVNSIFGE